MRTPSRILLGVSLVLGALNVSTWSATAAGTPESAPVVDPTGLSLAARGARSQVGPIEPPPSTCVPGSFVRRVETGGKKLVALTFDDGPWPTNTEKVMNAIEAYGGKATFFMIANNALKYPTIGRSVADRGHEVGNHSVSHQYIVRVLIDELVPADNILQSVTGVRPRVYRSPGLTASQLLQQALADYGGRCNIWANILSGDAAMPRPSSETICARFRSGLKPGSIILLHDGGSHTTTVNAVPCMAAYAVSQGYQMVTVSELMGQGYSTV